MSRSEFDQRWRELARSAQGSNATSIDLGDVARRARERDLEPLALLSARAGWSLAALAAALTAWLAPSAFLGDEALRELELAASRAWSSPPALPPPPGLESPSYYLAVASDAWRELTP